MLTNNLPYIILKYASTLNGIIGSNNKQRLIISNELDHKRVMEIRSQVDAIIIGAGTLVKDNPELTLRDETLIKQRIALGLKAQPLRIILANREIKDKGLNLFRKETSETILFSNAHDPMIPSHVKQIQYTSSHSHLLNAITILSASGVKKVLIEGGANILAEAISLGIASELRILYSPKYPKQGIKIPILDRTNFNIIEKKVERLGNQFALHFKLTPKAIDPSHAQ